jgi:type IV pilus assembly protein PilC
MHKLDDFNLLLFLKQFRVLLSDGLSVADSLELISKHISDQRFKKYLVSAHKDLKSGKNLYDALFGKAHPFPESMARCVRSMPQKDHQLELTIKSLEENYGTRTELVQKPFSLLPSIGVTLFSLFLVALFLLFVVPVFADMYSGFGRALPVLTQFVINVSLFLIRYWFLVLLIIAAVYYLIFLRRVKFGFRDADLYYTFSLMLGQLKSGANIKQMLSWAADSLDNPRMGERLHSVLRDVENGKTLSESFRHAAYFPLFVADIIALAEKKGDLKPAMEEIVSYYSIKKEWDLRISILPIIVVIFAIIFFIWAMYLPIFRMAGAIG